MIMIMIIMVIVIMMMMMMIIIIIIDETTQLQHEFDEYPPPPPFPPTGDFSLIGCLTSRHYTSVCTERIWSDDCTCCHTEVEAADQTCYLTQ